MPCCLEGGCREKTGKTGRENPQAGPRQTLQRPWVEENIAPASSAPGLRFSFRQQFLLRVRQRACYLFIVEN